MYKVMYDDIIYCLFDVYVKCLICGFTAQIPKKGKIYSLNEGNAKNWDNPTSNYI